MTNAQRIIVNTAAQYTRTVLNVCLSLYSTRLILSALGQTDYGIYSLVAGVVAMLSFITNALVTTTQRYLSFYHGTGDKEQLYRIFGNSLLLHLLIGGILLIVLSALTYPVVHQFIRISPERLTAATVVYLSASFMLFLSFVTAPFRALFIARENIIYISVIDVIDGLLKLAVALFLTHITSADKLMVYAVLIAGISLFNLLAFGGYAGVRFPECHLPHLQEWNKLQIKDLSGFAGWTMYSTGCVIARTQGIAVLFNRFFGAALNAAYGIAQQVNGAVAFIAQAIANAMSPQIIKAYGQGNSAKMLALSATASKCSLLLFSMVAIPLIAEMDAVLHIWLGTDIPPYTTVFCQLILIGCICDQTTMGLTIANQATGKIKYYSLIINTTKLMTLPTAWFCLRSGLACTSVMGCYVGFELFCALLRLPYLKVTQQLSISHFCVQVLLRSFTPIAVSVLLCYISIRFIQLPYRFCLTCVLSATGYCLSAVLTSFNKEEKNIIKHLLKKKKRA